MATNGIVGCGARAKGSPLATASFPDETDSDDSESSLPSLSILFETPRGKTEGITVKQKITMTEDWVRGHAVHQAADEKLTAQKSTPEGKFNQASLRRKRSLKGLHSDSEIERNQPSKRRSTRSYDGPGNGSEIKRKSPPKRLSTVNEEYEEQQAIYSGHGAGS
ncbi:hypothetical protein GQ53DRAFT_775554 [Thozetella sp. PMI_491]|nr:hypothetical protein GQ53DRAFT_775554 [Thozetella sp. PMI_491]